MRHKKSINHLGRKSAHREAMLANMAISLITHKKIETTLAKAKALRTFVEPLITKSKDDSTHSRRMVFSTLQNKEAVSELFREIAGKVADRPGGYTRILKTGNRLGDNAEMCIIELVDYNENLLDKKADAAKSKRKRAKKKPTASVESEAKETVAKVETHVEAKEVKASEVADEPIAEESKTEESKAEESTESEEETEK